MRAAVMGGGAGREAGGEVCVCVCGGGGGWVEGGEERTSRWEAAKGVS